MNMKINKLNYNYNTEYTKLITSDPHLNDRATFRILSKDVCNEVMTKCFSGEDTTQPIWASNVGRFPVFEALPGLGKTTGLIQISIPTITNLLYPEDVVPVWVIVIPSSNDVFNQTADQIQKITSEHLIQSYNLGSKHEILDHTKYRLRSKIAGERVKGFVILTKQSMINGGAALKAAKPYIKNFFNKTLCDIKVNYPDHRLFVAGLFDEVRVSSHLTPTDMKFKTKNPILHDVSYMPAVLDWMNESMLPHCDVFHSMGFDGTPTYDITGKAPKAEGGNLFEEPQDSNFSIKVDYGGNDSIWKYKPLSEPIWKGANSLDVSYFNGMVTKPKEYWTELLDKALKDVTDMNNYNKKSGKDLNLLLEKYGVRVYDRLRCTLVISGADSDYVKSPKYTEGKEIEEHYISKNIPHLFYTDDMSFCYRYDGKIKHTKPDNMDGEQWQTSLYEMLMDGEFDTVVIKRKLQWGWDYNPVLGVVGLSEYTDMFKKHPTMKPFHSQGQTTGRAVRTFTGLVDFDGNMISIRETGKLIKKIRGENVSLADKILNLVIMNNQFLSYQFKTGSSGSNVDGQLEVWLDESYPSQEDFESVFDNYIEDCITDVTTISDPECCPSCGCVNFGVGCKTHDVDDIEINLEKTNEALKI